MDSNFRTSISCAVKALRHKRCFSQAEFARLLNITQGGLSHIESGKSSLSAEQLIFLIEKFNLSLDDFVKRKKVLPEQELQNAMARLGAAHLKEYSQVIVPETLLDTNEVVYQVLSKAHHSRLIIHLAPVVIANIAEIHFVTLFERLFLLEKQYRIWWLVEQVCKAAQMRIKDKNLSKQRLKIYQNAERFLSRRKDEGEVLDHFKPAPDRVYDILDNEAISWRYANKLQERSDEIAKKWRIISSLTTNDFYEALKETDEYDK